MRFNFALLSTLIVILPACGEEKEPDPGTDTLYQRLGGNAGIKSAVDKVFAAEAMDAEIAAYFTHAAQYPGAPSADQIKACLTLQLANAADGPEHYPSLVTGGFMCRSMAEAHAHLGITTAAFDKFVMIAANTLT